MPNVITPPSGNFHFQKPDTPPRAYERRAPKAEAPLLPPVLGGPAAFLWLWVLPIAILLGLNVEGYALIEGNMSEVQRSRALWVGVANAVNLLAGLVLFFAAKALAARPASSAANLIARTAPALAVQIGYLWFAFVSTNAIPASVRVWIYPESRFLFNQFSFAMLPLFVGILHLACAQRGAAAGRAIAVNLGLAIAAPMLLFVIAHGARMFQGGFVLPAIVVSTTVVALGVAMFIGLVRALMVGLRSAQRGGDPTTERLAIACVALAMPLGGLLLNRAIEFPVDFQAWEVYALTIANAAILLFASWRAAQAPRLSFALLCVTFPFSLYFFIVFLPYTPLSIFAVLLLGAGFLVLTPTLLFALHLHLLNKARHALRAQRGQRSIVITGVLCFLILPAAIVGRATADKKALNAALQHVYAPAITGGDIVFGRNVVELRRALSSHRSYKNGIYYPLLSDFYAWWVFNHLVLPDDKLARLEQTFLGVAGAKESHDPLRNPNRGAARGGSSVRAQSRLPRGAQLPHSVVAGRLVVHSRAVDGSNSIVTCALTLHNPGTVADEYVKALPLPAGIFVSGYRLQVGGVLVPGRIFEKKTALWVYTMIRDTQRRDPGLLYYNRPDELELRVFPVGAHESTVVEIDFLVPGEVITADLPPSRDAASVLAELGRRITPQLMSDSRGGFFSMGGSSRAELPVVEREPYLHVIVDRSLDGGYTGDLRSALRMLEEKFPAARRARITLANHDVVDLVPELARLAELSARNFGDWQRKLPPSGTVALDLALAHAIRRHRDQDLDRPVLDGALPPRPVFVILSRDGTSRPFELSLTENWLDLVPEFELHELAASGSFTTHRKVENAATPLVRWGDSVRPLHATRAVRFAAGAKDAKVEVWSPAHGDWRPVAVMNAQPGATSWSRAAALTLAQLDNVRSPGDAAVDLPGLVRASRESGILLGGTSYIVVENAAQWRMLERSEHQKLSQHAALEFLETPAPPAVYIALAFAGWLFFRHWHHRRRRVAAA